MASFLTILAGVGRRVIRPVPRRRRAELVSCAYCAVHEVRPSDDGDRDESDVVNDASE
jgi:hypothetical protein